MSIKLINTDTGYDIEIIRSDQLVMLVNLLVDIKINSDLVLLQNVDYHHQNLI